MTDRAQTILDALAAGKLTVRQYAELQAMYWELDPEEQDAIDRWEKLAGTIKRMEPGEPHPTLSTTYVIRGELHLSRRGMEALMNQHPTNTVDLARSIKQARLRSNLRILGYVLLAALALLACARLAEAAFSERDRVLDLKRSHPSYWRDL